MQNSKTKTRKTPRLPQIFANPFSHLLPRNSSLLFWQDGEKPFYPVTLILSTFSTLQPRHLAHPKFSAIPLHQGFQLPRTNSPQLLTRAGKSLGSGASENFPAVPPITTSFLHLQSGYLESAQVFQTALVQYSTRPHPTQQFFVDKE